MPACAICRRGHAATLRSHAPAPGSQHGLLSSRRACAMTLVALPQHTALRGPSRRQSPRAKCRTCDARRTSCFAALLLQSPRPPPSRCTALPCTASPSTPPGFQHFPYVNPDAPKGGRLVLGALGTFDSLNPFIIKGVTPAGVREYVFESLMARSGDEPFTLYGLIAESVELPDDRGSDHLHLRPRPASPTARPSRPRMCSSATDAEGEGLALPSLALRQGRRRPRRSATRSVRFTFDAAGDREIPLILGLLPVLPRHNSDPETFERTTLEPPVGSGPYASRGSMPDAPSPIRRNPDWWARDLPVMRGRFNFEEIRVEYFRDCRLAVRGLQGRRDRRARRGRSRPLDRGLRFPRRHGRPRHQARVRDAACPRACRRWSSTRAARSSPTRACAAPSSCCSTASGSTAACSTAPTSARKASSSAPTLSSHGRPADARERALLAALRRLREARGPGRHLWRSPSTDGSGNNRANLRGRLSSCSRRPATSSKDGRLVKGGELL